MEGWLYRNDKTMKVTRLGEKTFCRLVLQGVSTVAHMKALTDNTIQMMESSDSKLKLEILSNWHQEAQTCLDKDAPACEDFRKAINPYEARFGEDNWMSAMKAAYHMSTFVCTTDMIEHIVKESAKVFEGTEHKDKWVFYHDALSLMTADATIAWIKE